MTQPTKVEAKLPAPSTALKEADWPSPPPVTLADGTRIQLYKDGQALAAGYEAIRRAKRRICMEFYIFRSDTTGMAFADLLAEKARAGLAVYVVYDSFGCWETSPSLFRKMKRAGVRLREFHPINPWESRFGWRPLNRDHRKLIIVDDEVAGMGGLNIGAEYAGSSIIKTETMLHWRDNGIAITGPSVRLLVQSFIRTWRYIHSGGRIRRAQFIHDIDHAVFGVLASVPTINSPLRPFLSRLFNSAQQSIDLTMAYFAPDDGLIEDLTKAAARGVRVRLMLPGKSDIRFLEIAARSFYETLLNKGVQVYERQGAMLHAKTMVIDDCISVMGSTNLDYRSIEYNCELSAIIRNCDFGSQMKDLFQHDMKYAERITLERWRYRPTSDRLVQWGVSRARYLL
jgi:cardiolipin synthase A/B